jgi:phosphoserine phosphatase
MEDTRRDPAGKLAAEGMKKASEFMETFNPSKDSTAQTTEKLINEAVKAGMGTYEAVKGMVEKNMSPEFKDMLNRFKETISEKSNEIDLPSLSKELLQKIKQESEPLIDKGKEILRNTFDLNVKVDLNSGSPELADMFVSEVNKNPKLRASLAESILTNKKAFVA